MQRVWTAHRAYPWLGSDKNSLLYCPDRTSFFQALVKNNAQTQKMFSWISIQSFWESQNLNYLNIF